MMIDLHAVGARSYIAEPDRGRRHWAHAPAAQQAVYGNRRRVRGARGKRLLRRRGEYAERSFAHVYDTGGMSRTHLRGHPNILKRLFIHASAFNLGILMRQVFGVGAPRRLQGRPVDACALESPSLCSTSGSGACQRPSGVLGAPLARSAPPFRVRYRLMANRTFTTDC